MMLEFFIAFLLTMGSDSRDVLWTGPFLPEDIKPFRTISAHLKSEGLSSRCDLRKAREALERAHSHYEFMELEEARRLIRSAVSRASRRKMCSSSWQVLAQAHLLRGIIALVEGKYSIAKRFFKKAAFEGFWEPLSPDDYPSPVTRLHREVLSSLKWCELRVDFPLTSFSVRVNGRSITAGDSLPCGRHLVEVFAGGISVGGVLAERVDSPVFVPFSATPEALEALVKKGVVKAWINSQEKEGIVTLSIFTSEGRTLVETNPEKLTQTVVEVLDVGDPFQERSLTPKKESSLTYEEGVFLPQQVFQLEDFEKEGKSGLWWRSPYLWGAVVTGLAVSLGVWAAFTYTGEKDKRASLIITW